MDSKTCFAVKCMTCSDMWVLEVSPEQREDIKKDLANVVKYMCDGARTAFFAWFKDHKGSNHNKVMGFVQLIPKENN